MKNYNNLRRWGDFIAMCGILVGGVLIFFGLVAIFSEPGDYFSETTPPIIVVFWGLAVLLGGLFQSSILGWMADVGENLSRLARPHRVVPKEDLEARRFGEDG